MNSDKQIPSEQAAAEPRIRVGVDVGGTFTDFVLVDDHRGTVFTGKLLTSSRDPSLAIIEGLEHLLLEAGTAIAALDSVVHGTTLVTNTVIERKGAKVGLITTKGFRDSIEMGREIRYDLYDLFFDMPEPLVPRQLRLEVDERVDADGKVLRALDPEAVREAGRRLLEQGCEAIAVCFLHAYRNPEHEQLARQVLAEAADGIPICISSEVAPEIREFERANTACANAYVQPLMRGYLRRLETKLAELGLRAPLHVMLSGGGLTTVEAAQEFPIRLIESGPAAGAMAASFYSRLTGIDALVSFDMGGTTAKMCLIENGRLEHAHDFEAARVRRFRKGSGIPLKVPVVDLIEIGAGGGSIARIDQMGLVKVGPDSAGSDPGPVCYGQGGTEPTVTDADLLLGYLSPDYFLGGAMGLDAAAVEGAVEERIAAPLGLATAEAAAGIHSIVNENMAAATRMYIAEKGRDPRRYSLIAFGGAGPVHAYGFAKLLKISRIICPLGAGVMSALGFLVAPFAIDYVRSYMTKLDSIDWSHLQGLFDDMERQAATLLKDAKVHDFTIERKADMRYVGQGFEISVPLPQGPIGPEALPQIRESFLDAYEALFSRRITDVPIEAMSWRLNASGPVRDVTLGFAGREGVHGSALKGTREAHFPETGFVTCNVYDRYALAVGQRIAGPAIVEERESTVVFGPDAEGVVDEHLNLIIEIKTLQPGAKAERRAALAGNHP